MTTMTERALSEKTTCFYSIKLGNFMEREFRQDCIENGKIALNFGMTPERHQRLVQGMKDEEAFKSLLSEEFKKTYQENQHRFFYRPEPHAVWLTVDKGCLYYAEDLEALTEGDFSPVAPNGWLQRRVSPWRKVDLPISKLPGVIRNLGVQRQTIVEIPLDRKPDFFQLIKNVINQEKPLVQAYRNMYSDRARNIEALIQKLDPDDFETLVDLILYRMAYIRESILGEQEKAFDGIYKDLRDDSFLYVQVKCLARLKELEEFRADLENLAEVEERSEGLFVYHSGDIPASGGGVRVWDIRQVAEHAIRLGIEPWILDRVYA